MSGLESMANLIEADDIEDMIESKNLNRDAETALEWVRQMCAWREAARQ